MGCGFPEREPTPGYAEEKIIMVNPKLLTALLLNEQNWEALGEIIGEKTAQRIENCLRACRNISDHALETGAIDALVQALKLTLFDMEQKAYLRDRDREVIRSRLKAALDRVGAL